MRRPSILLLLALSDLALACSGRTVGPAADRPPPAADGAYGGDLEPLPPPSGLASDTGANPRLDGPPSDDDAGAGDGAAPSVENSDGGVPEGACISELGPGDLRIDELMIESVAGAGDDGEWLEIASTVACTANLNGLHGECPRGAKVATFDVTSDVWIPPGGTFVVADSSDPAINHSLPGTLVVWLGHAGDVLRNKGSTITLTRNGTMIDTLTYPALSLEVGRSVAFPPDCDAGARGDFAQWQRSTASWFPGFFGTPNAPNDDVQCP